MPLLSYFHYYCWITSSILILASRLTPGHHYTNLTWTAFSSHVSKLSFPFLPQYEFSPQTLCCYGKQLCTIPRDGTYYSYQNRWDDTLLWGNIHVVNSHGKRLRGHSHWSRRAPCHVVWFGFSCVCGLARSNSCIWDSGRSDTGIKPLCVDICMLA